MSKKVDPDDGGSPMGRRPLVIGAAIYIAGFLALVAVVGVAKLPLGSYAPFNGAAPQSVSTASSPTPFIYRSPVSTRPVTTETRPQQPVALASSTPRPAASGAPTPGSASASGKTPTGSVHTPQLKTPRATFSPCAKPSRVHSGPMTAVRGRNPITTPAASAITTPAARPVTTPTARETVASTRGVDATPIAHAARSRPTKPHSEPITSGEEQRHSFVLLLPIPKTRGVRVYNDLDPRADPPGSLLIHPPAAPTPPAPSSDSQSH